MNNLEQEFYKANNNRSYTIAQWAPYSKFNEDVHEQIMWFSEAIELGYDKSGRVGEVMRHRLERAADYNSIKRIESSIDNIAFDKLLNEDLDFNEAIMNSKEFYSLQQWIMKYEKSKFIPTLKDIEYNLELYILIDDMGFRKDDNSIEQYYLDKVLLKNKDSILVEIENIPFKERSEPFVEIEKDLLYMHSKRRFHLTGQPYRWVSLV